MILRWVSKSSSTVYPQG